MYHFTLCFGTNPCKINFEVVTLFRLANHVGNMTVLKKYSQCYTFLSQLSAYGMKVTCQYL